MISALLYSWGVLYVVLGWRISCVIQQHDLAEELAQRLVHGYPKRDLTFRDRISIIVLWPAWWWTL